MRWTLVALASSAIVWAALAIASGGYEVKYLALAIGAACGAAARRDGRPPLVIESVATAVLAIAAGRIVSATGEGAAMLDRLFAMHANPVGLVAYFAAAAGAWLVTRSPARRAAA